MKNTFDRFRPRMPAVPLASLLLAVCLVGCQPAASAPAGKPAEPPVAVKTTQPRRGEITRTISLPATVAANQQATLYSKVAGYLKTIAVDKGDDAKAGQLLAEIEVPELLADFARYKAEAEIADLDYKRAAEAHKQASDLVVLQSVDTAKAKWLMAKANLERAETLLGFCRLTAPFSGVVTKRMVDPGAFIPAATSGSAAQNAALLTLMDFNKVRVQVAVPEPEVPFIVKGLTARITVDELPGRTFAATITRYAHALDDASKTMLVEADLPNADLVLRPGMYAMIKIGVEKHPDALLIPVEALVTEKTNAFVFLAADGKARKTAIKAGFNDGAKVEVLAGLNGGEAVILTGRMTLADGQPIQAREAP